jgi:hypothetical protein
MVNHQTFDWIMFAILGIPLALGVVQIAKPDWLERFIRER